MNMDVIHAYAKARKSKDADCATCRFAELTSKFPTGEPALLCRERMYDEKTLKCYLPREESKDENP